jgi:hypothetical protein
MRKENSQKQRWIIGFFSLALDRERRIDKQKAETVPQNNLSLSVEDGTEVKPI